MAGEQEDRLGRLRRSLQTLPEPDVADLDHAQRGLGTASCGPDTAEQYRLLERSYRFSYTLAPIDARATNDAPARPVRAAAGASGPPPA